jgi:DNA invertase Pin-like site-specific DNA recombinase
MTRVASTASGRSTAARSASWRRAFWLKSACQIAEELQRKHVHLQVLDQQIDTNDATGRLLFHMLGAIAQFETELRAERQMEGIQNAKARGVLFGRHKSLTQQQIAELQERRRQGTLIQTLMRDYRVAKATAYRYLEGVSPAQPEEPPEFV